MVTVPDEVDNEDLKVLLTALSYLTYACAQAAKGEIVETPPEFWPWDKEAWKPTGLEQNLTRVQYQIAFVLQRIDKYNERAKTAATESAPDRFECR